MSPDKLELVKIKISKAKELLAEVVDFHIENKLWNTSVNRLYYACFQAVSALLAVYDLNAKTHSGVRQLFGLHFVKTGKVNEATGEFYSTLFGMRQKADYEDLIEYERQNVLPLIQPATDLILIIEELLSKA